MEILVMVMVVLAFVTFILKQTFHRPIELAIISVVLLVFTGNMWSYAIEQSKTMISSWLADGQLMLDIAVLLSIDVAITLFFCVMQVEVSTAERVGSRKRIVAAVLKYFPNLIIFPVLFAMVVALIFSMPGAEFSTVSWGLGIAVLIVIPAGVYGMKLLLPEEELRLELLFLLTVVLALMGVIATVNGRTAVTGIENFELMPLLLVIGMVIAGVIVGYCFRIYRLKKIINKTNI